MRRWILFLTACVLSLFLFGSCTSTRTETITEYVPAKIDLAEVIEPVFQLRPDNSKMDICIDVETVADVVHNSVLYQSAWELWQGYAETLEDVLLDIDDVYGNKKDL